MQAYLGNLTPRHIKQRSASSLIFKLREPTQLLFSNAFLFSIQCFIIDYERVNSVLTLFIFVFLIMLTRFCMPFFWAFFIDFFFLFIFFIQKRTISLNEHIWRIIFNIICNPVFCTINNLYFTRCIYIRIFMEMILSSSSFLLNCISKSWISIYWFYFVFIIYCIHFISWRINFASRNLTLSCKL